MNSYNPLKFLSKIVFLMLLCYPFAPSFAVDRFICNSGMVPKFSNNRALFHIEPALWDNRENRESIISAFEEWNSATGWKMKFEYKRGSGKGSFGDGQFQVRTKWLSGVNGRSIAIPTADSGQCTWWESDIEISTIFLRNGSGQRNLYRLMLHEIAHAIGMKHNKFISVVNKSTEGVSGLQSAYYDGLFGHDIRFARNVYGFNSGNIKRNFRSDVITLDESSKALRSFFTTDVSSNGRAKVIYTVTNEGTGNEQVRIEALSGENQGDLFNSRAKVEKTTLRWIFPGGTITGTLEFNVNQSELPKNIGFRVKASDRNIWDDIVSTWSR